MFVVGLWDGLKNILDAVRFILAEYGLVAMHGGRVYANVTGVWFSDTSKYNLGKYTITHMNHIYIPFALTEKCVSGLNVIC